MSAAARPIETTTSYGATMSSLSSENALLLRDLKAARARNAVLMRALNGEQQPQAIAKAGYAESINHILAQAQSAERAGIVPCVRFSRNADGIISGIELSVLMADGIAGPRLVEEPMQFAGMAVVDGDEL